MKIMLSTIFFVGLISSIVLAQSTNVPDFGLMFNDDGDRSFTDDDMDKSMENLRAQISSLVDSPIDTYVRCISCGSDVMHYPTNVGSRWGWRKVTSKSRIIHWNTIGVKSGNDILRVSGELTKKIGKKYVLSYRMNDAHFALEPNQHPLTGEFWINNPTLLIHDSPVPDAEHYANLLNFAEKKVREYRMGIIFECIDRYYDVIDGFELDFMRHPVLFPKGHSQENAHLLTEMIKDIREKLDSYTAKDQMRKALLVRVPPSLRTCRWAGLEVEKWMKERYVDVVIPATLYTVEFEMPVSEFVEASKGTGCKVYSSVYERTPFIWNFDLANRTENYKHNERIVPVKKGTYNYWKINEELYRAAASNAWAQGAKGLEIFNYRLPLKENDIKLFRSLDQSTDIKREDKVYLVSPVYYLTNTNTFLNERAIPAQVSPDQPAELTLLAYEDFQNNYRHIQTAALRIGLADSINTNAVLEIVCNGKTLFENNVENVYAEIKNERSGGGGFPPPTQSYLQIKLDGEVLNDFFRTGQNQIEINLTQEALITELSLWLIYNSQVL